MKLKYPLLFFFSAIFLLRHFTEAQTYCMPTSGVQTVNTHTGTFYDSGCAAGNYSNNENGAIIFCPDTSCMLSVDFTPSHPIGNTDVLRIFGGNDTNSFYLGSMFGNPLGEIIFCSTDTATGCITFHFISDGAVTAAGWTASIRCCSSTSAEEIKAALSGSSLTQDLNGNYFLNLNLHTPLSFTLNIFSADGKNISEKNYSRANGHHQIPIDAQNLSEGIYFCRIVGEKFNKSFKFIK